MKDILGALNIYQTLMAMEKQKLYQRGNSG
jgi:hypothetical protein